MNNRWTGGQYSVFRALLGGYLCVHFVQLLGWGAEVFSNQGCLPDGAASPLIGLFPNILALADGPGAVAAMLIAGAGLSLCLAVGFFDRVAAVAIWYIWACLFGRNPLIANPSLPYVGWMLLAHACLDPAPYGSHAARGRSDPGGGWRFAREVFVAAWIVMAVGYSYSGWTKLASPSWIDGSALARVLENPLARPGCVRELVLALPAGVLAALTWGALALELFYVPLALHPLTRRLAWGAMLALHLGLILLIDFADLSLAMVLFHLFTFDPGWVAPSDADVEEVLFYDGSCGLCHGFVRFVLAEDRSGRPLRLAPLAGAYFSDVVPESVRARLPDSLVLLTGGRLLVRSAAVLHVLGRLGGLWRLVSIAGSIVPGIVLDRAYDAVAAVRRRAFDAPSQACPIVPGPLYKRFITRYSSE